MFTIERDCFLWRIDICSFSTVISTKSPEFRDNLLAIKFGILMPKLFPHFCIFVCNSLQNNIGKICFEVDNGQSERAASLSHSYLSTYLTYLILST